LAIFLCPGVELVELIVHEAVIAVLILVVHEAVIVVLILIFVILIGIGPPATNNL
jgi:hypothetical protein